MPIPRDPAPQVPAPTVPAGPDPNPVPVLAADGSASGTAQGHVRRLAAPLAALGITTVAVVAVASLDLDSSGPSFCPLRTLTGLDCPFCGSTRAAGALARGEVVPALDHNALFVLVILPLAVLAWVVWVRRAWRGQRFPDVPTRLVVGLMALTGAWWVLRLAVPWLGSGLS
jgi:hypothetical protein